MDEIRIEQLELFCNHGVFPEENVLGQKFLVSAILYTDTRKAGKSDKMEDSIHYGEICGTIK
ncbi:MAG: dihydroneopterin aldolase, partial [Lachnospiraceae bacterium]|nr:dihydroneopterin aldolase [Lachnospiraceae bacterium]